MNHALPVPRGFRFAAIDAGIAKGERADLALVVADEPRPAAALFTTNRIVASPVALSKEHMKRSNGQVRAILINAGNANACTGEQGDADAHRCATLVGEALSCPVEQVLVFSTGVIGSTLPMAAFESGIPTLVEALSEDSGSALSVADAILTTDTVRKTHSGLLPANGDTKEAGDCTLLGLAKGSGMIHPDMATMLAFLFTDAKTEMTLDLALRAAARQSFLRISVDGDTSTNDSVLLWSSELRETDTAGFLEELDSATLDLAKQIVRDGEGATKCITVEVRAAQSLRHAELCARTIAMSPLVKTAVHGQDPNWGRILAAAGRSDVPIDTRKVRVGIGDVVLFENDAPLPENEREAARQLEGKDVRLWVELGTGEQRCEFYGCDLSADYVRINADYRS